MKKHSFGLIFTVYAVGLAVCVALRCVLRLGYIDLETGFYSGAGTLAATYNILLALFVAGLLVVYVLRKSQGDYPVLRRGRSVGALALATGLALILSLLETARIGPFGTTVDLGVQLSGISLALVLATGAGAGAAFLLTGARGVLKGKLYGGLTPLCAGVWMILTLVCKFNKYTTLTAISDNLLATMFMLSGALFLTAHARTLCGLERKDGRNYAIPAGLCTSLFGFLLTVPNILYMAINRVADLPAPLLGRYECVFVFMLSVYASAFSVHLCRSIKSV